MADLDVLKDYYLNAVNETQTQRELAEKDRDYYDGVQYTTEQLEEYKRRKQPPIISNRIKPKVDSMLGMEIQTRTDVKAFPRNPQDEDTAEAATDALRYIADNTDFDKTKTSVAKNLFIEGTSAGIVEVEFQNGDFVILPRQIPWDRFFNDPHAAEMDGSDSKYMGQAIWMDFDDFKRKFPQSDMTEADFGHMNEDSGDTYDDKPRDVFFDKSRKRVKIIEIYHREDTWRHAIFSGFEFVVEDRKSPYVDEWGEPVNPIEMQHAFIDRDNKAYGSVRQLITLQDEINNRRSKALHLLNKRQVIADEGAVQNVQRARRELTKPDGWVETNPGRNFEIQETGDLAIGQLNLLQEAKNEIDAVGANAAITGKEDRVMSGRALQSRQQSGVIELTPILDQLRDWQNRMYRQMWLRVKQYWTAEKWVRVTDDEQNIQFVALNRPVTAGEQLQSQGVEVPEMLAQDPRFNQVVRIENNVQDMDMDIILEDVPDIVNLQAEQFELLANMYAANPEAIPFEMIIEMSSIRNKDRIIERLQGGTDEERAAFQARQQAQAQEAAEQNTLLKAEKVAEIENTQADTQKKLSEARENAAQTVDQQIDTQLKIVGGP